MKAIQQLFYPCFALVLAATDSFGAALVIDSFDQGGFSLSIDGTVANTSTVLGPLSTVRSERLRARNSPSGTTFTTTLDESDGFLVFALAEPGPLLSDPAPSLHLAYGGSGPHSILGYSAFEFQFLSVSGTGFLIVELGSESIKNDSTLRVPISGSGALSVPFDQINFGSGGTLESFSTINFEFEGQSSDFTFALNEIRVVPEPAILMLFIFGAGAALAKRGRH